MDYEKMYNEALKRAKKFEEKYGGGYAEYIFPELAESEDERIRKELKEAFEAYDIESKWNGIPVRSIIAWLEKQKKQKPGWSEEDEKMLDSIIKVVCGVGVQPNGLREKQVSFLKSLRPQYHGDVTMTEAYKMGLEAGKASSWKPSEEQMEALKKVTGNAVDADEYYPALATLYYDLKEQF